MKLIVQIPCFNEEHTLPQTVADIPRDIEGIDSVEILIIDDGSTDRTIEVARKIGVDHIIRSRRNRGLALTFRTGIEACLERGADIIVNTDGDNQYAGADIPKLVGPILEGKADIVIGDRQTDTLIHFSPFKRLLQRLGSAVVRRLSGTAVPDTVSGFRAYTRDAALRLNVISSFSYTIETVIQAGMDRQAVTAVPVATNPKTRESRLFKSLGTFLQSQVMTIVRMYSMYRPLLVFTIIGAILVLIGAVPIVRFLYFYFVDGGQGHIQSLLLGAMFVVLGFITFMFAMLADLIHWNRRLIEMTLEKVRRLELARSSGPMSQAQASPNAPGQPREEARLGR